MDLADGLIRPMKTLVNILFLPPIITASRDARGKKR
jgi:hypothetical protein